MLKTVILTPCADRDVWILRRISYRIPSQRSHFVRASSRSQLNFRQNKIFCSSSSLRNICRYSHPLHGFINWSPIVFLWVSYGEVCSKDCYIPSLTEYGKNSIFWHNKRADLLIRDVRGIGFIQQTVAAVVLRRIKACIFFSEQEVVLYPHWLDRKIGRGSTPCFLFAQRYKGPLYLRSCGRRSSILANEFYRALIE